MALLSVALTLAVSAQTLLQLQPGDHVAIVGGGIADRMQHSGYFETLIHDRFPDHRLVFRNLAAAGDEVANRHRSENFGSPDDWLTRVKSDVIIAFFGYNESFKGQEGLQVQGRLGCLGETRPRRQLLRQGLTAGGVGFAGGQ
jgi:hypothetical protein